MIRAFLIFLFLLPPGYLAYLIFMYVRTRVPYVVTPHQRLPLIMAEMQITPETVIYDLGCGKGDVLYAAEKFHPKKLVGYELSPLHAGYAKIKAWWTKSKVHIYQKDFFTADITDADIIYLFLVQSMVEKIWPKIEQETRPGTKVIILSNTIPGLPVQHITEQNNEKTKFGGLYIYIIGLKTKNRQ